MGLGRWNGKRHLPITPWEGSWAQKMENRRNEGRAQQDRPRDIRTRQNKETRNAD